MAEGIAPEEGARPDGKRGEAAWKADRERIAERNQQARKAGKAERQAHEQRKSEHRRDADLRDRASLPSAPGSG